MFSKGQIIFALLFFMFFVITITISYQKDLKENKLHYKGTYKILISFIIGIILLFVIKFSSK